MEACGRGYIFTRGLGRVGLVWVWSNGSILSRNSYSKELNETVSVTMSVTITVCEFESKTILHIKSGIFEVPLITVIYRKMFAAKSLSL